MSPDRGLPGGKPGLKRFLRVTPAGLLRTGKAKIKTEESAASAT